MEEKPLKEKYDHSHPWTSTVTTKNGESSKSWEERVGDGHELFDLERSSNDDGLERLGELDGYVTLATARRGADSFSGIPENVRQKAVGRTDV